MCKSLVVNARKLSGCENLLGCSMETEREMCATASFFGWWWGYLCYSLFPAFARKARSLDGKMTLLDCSPYKA
jgi:hypothetical protein